MAKVVGIRKTNSLSKMENLLLIIIDLDMDTSQTYISLVF